MVFKKRRMVICLLFLLPCITAQAVDIYVPDAYPTIQEAIQASSDNDQIIVRDGTYIENINFLGKAITLTSENGASATIIDGNQSHSVVTFRSGEGSSSVLTGFTIRNGLDDEGGGIFCGVSTSPTLTENVIHGNTAGHGGGIYCVDASPDIAYNAIYGNEAGFGGGCYCLNASPTLTDNSFVGNRAASLGGGFACRDLSSPTLEGNIISMNDADAGGGVMTRNQATPRLMNNTISFNMANTGGGILCTESGAAVIMNNTISENTAELGGGLCCRYTATPVLSNNTVMLNAADTGGGIYCWQAEPEIIDSIFWENQAIDGAEFALVAGSVLHIAHSNVQGGQAMVSLDIVSSLDWGTGMIDADPLFTAGANGLYYLSQIAAGQVQDSPCLDAGSGTAASVGMDPYWTRTDGVPDTSDVDMGFHYGPFSSSWTVPLYPDVYTHSTSAGGTIEFTLDAGPSKGGRPYLILGSLSGTEPGFFLPGGLTRMHLNIDGFTHILIDLAFTASPITTNFFDTLDASGESKAQFNVPPLPPGALGTEMFFAYTLDWPWEYASNPVEIAVVP